MGKDTCNHFPRRLLSLREPRNLQIPRKEIFISANAGGLRSKGIGTV